MPWATPTLREVRSLVRDHIRGTLPGADASVPNSVLRVISDSQGALCHLTLLYIDWLALQLLPDTAETEWLDRHGDIWLVNSDSTTGRKMANKAVGTATFTGTAGTIVPNATQLASGGAIGFETTQQITLAAAGQPTPATIRALDPGTAGNLIAGSPLGITTTIPGVDGQAFVVSLTGGTEIESDNDLRIRVLERIRQPPMGGAAYDYVAWAKAVPGVTRAWAAQEMGVGTVTVRVMMDELRADNDGFPEEDDLIPVEAYIDQKRPVTVKDHWVLAPIKVLIDVEISDLFPDTTATRAAIEQSLIDMMFVQAKPGQTIYAAWKSFAVMNAPEVQSFTMIDNIDDVMPSIGHMAVLGDILFS